jgi:hypothetical protein
MNPSDYVEREIHAFNRKGIEFIKRALGELFRSLVRPLATITEVYFRMDFGVRYFTLWNVLAGLVLISMSNIPLSYVADVRRGVPHPQLHVNDIFVALVSLSWFLSFAVMSFVHLLYMRQRLRSGVHWHSYSCGYSYVPERLQPFIPVAVGVVLFCLGVWTPGLLLIASGLTSASLRRSEKWAFFKRVLDTLDAQIEAENLSEAVMNRGRGQKTAGFAAPLPAVIPDSTRRKFLQSAAGGEQPPRSTNGSSDQWAGQYLYSGARAAIQQMAELHEAGSKINSMMNRFGKKGAS